MRVWNIAKGAVNLNDKYIADMIPLMSYTHPIIEIKENTSKT